MNEQKKKKWSLEISSKVEYVVKCSSKTQNMLLIRTFSEDARTLVEATIINVCPNILIYPFLKVRYSLEK
jgi:hypothetical protein